MHLSAIRSNIWHIEEAYRVYCTLIIGKTLSILWDTGLGEKDLALFLSEHVATPYIVMNSHGHADHIGGNRRFSEVYAHPADWSLLYAHAAETSKSYPNYRLKELLPGMRFDLGGLHGRVISLVGHTCGSVGLLLEEEGLLLAGDALNPTMLFGPEAASLEAWKETLLAVQELPAEAYLTSHSPNPVSMKQIAVHLRHLEQLHPEPHPTPYGDGFLRSVFREKQGKSIFFLHKN